MEPQAGSDLAVGDPVRGHRRARGQQLLGHHVAVQMPQPVPAVPLRDGQAEEACRAQACGELLIPPGQPRINAGLPTELSAVGLQKVPHGEPHLDQLGRTGAQGVE